MTAEVIHRGHIECFRWLSQYTDWLIVGLLTDEALRGYKKCNVSWKDRAFVIDHIYIGGLLIQVVPQRSLNPYNELEKWKPDYIASGDGFEPEEKEAAAEMGIKLLNINFPKKWSTSKICKK